MTRLVVHPILWALVLASMLGSAGCSTEPFPPARATAMDESRRAAKIVQDREHELVVLRAELAATRIAAAKQDAELQELRALVTRLRHDNGETRQAVLDAMHQAESRHTELTALKAEREQLVAAKPAEPSQQDRQLAALEATVSTLTQEFAQLKQAMTVVVIPTSAKLPKARDPKPRESRSSKASQGERVTAFLPLPNVVAEQIIPAMHVLPDERSPTGSTPITVQPGDTLWGLARRHKTTIDALQVANGLSGEQLVVGRELRLP